MGTIAIFVVKIALAGFLCGRFGIFALVFVPNLSVYFEV